MKSSENDMWNMFESIGALQIGVILPSCNIKEELSKLSPDDARKAKRKWRKLIRKARKKFILVGDDIDPTFAFTKEEDKEYTKFLARRKLRFLGQEVVDGSNNKKRDQQVR